MLTGSLPGCNLQDCMVVGLRMYSCCRRLLDDTAQPVIAIAIAFLQMLEGCRTAAAAGEIENHGTDVGNQIMLDSYSRMNFDLEMLR